MGGEVSLQCNDKYLGSPLNVVDPKLENRFEVTSPLIVFSPPLSVFGRPLIQGGSSSLGGSSGLEVEEG